MWGSKRTSTDGACAGDRTRRDFIPGPADHHRHLTAIRLDTAGHCDSTFFHRPIEEAERGPAVDDTPTRARAWSAELHKCNGGGAQGG